MKERFKTSSAVFLLLMRNTILPEDLEFVCLIHKNCGDVKYYNGYFKAVKWSGEPEIKEPNKNDELKCFLFSFNISNTIYNWNYIICITSNLIISAYIGGLILDYISIRVLTIIAIALFAISIIPLLLLKFEHEKNTYKLSLKQTIKEVPTSDLYLFGSYELIFEYYNYNLLYEFTQNLFRSIVVFLLFISNFNIKNMVYITLLFIFIGVFLQRRNTEVDKQ